jgi:hypothetical protein
MVRGCVFSKLPAISSQSWFHLPNTNFTVWYFFVFIVVADEQRVLREDCTHAGTGLRRHITRLAPIEMYYEVVSVRKRSGKSHFEEKNAAIKLQPNTVAERTQESPTEATLSTCKLWSRLRMLRCEVPGSTRHQTSSQHSLLLFCACVTST